MGGISILSDHDEEEPQRPINCKTVAGANDYILIKNEKSSSGNRRWYCTKCTNDYEKMLLFPTNKDIPAEYWICSKCSRKITLAERDQVYEDIKNAVKEKHQLRQFDYDKKIDKWIIQSSEWTGEDRLPPNARKKIIEGERKQIINEVIHLIRSELQLYILNMKDFWIE